MKYIIITIIIYFFVQQTSAQNIGTIKGKLLTESKNNYTLLLKKSMDSSLVKVELNDKVNNFQFEKINYGSYFIEVSFMQDILFRTPNFSLNTSNYTCMDIPVAEKSTVIKEVKIIAQKNIVERKLDKIIYNVENTLEAPSNDALTVLQKAPGISVDADGNISMRGKRGVMLMINGKMTYLSGPQLANLLRTTTANQIAKIEVISNPSSKYDAEGNAGIVNIVLKKNQKQGTNGLIVLSYGMGKYHKSANGININIKQKKLALFSSYNYFNDKGFNDLHLYRQFYTNHVYDGAYRQANYLLFPNVGHIGKLGIDYTPDSKTTIGLVCNSTFNHFNPDGDNHTSIESNTSIDQSTYTSQNKSREKWYNYGINLNAKRALDSSGTEISMDADYAQYGNTANQNFVTQYYDLQNQELKAPYLLHGDVHSLLKIYAIKSDFVHPFRKNQKIEFGGKSSTVKSDNNLAYCDQSTGNSIFDSLQSNHFLYTENINALYSTYSIEKNKTSVQIGLRAEQTIAKGHQLMNDISFSRNYWQLFPTLFFTQKINSKHDCSISMSKRIQRPSYDQMNPVRLFIDASTFKQGNPYLVPQDSYLLEVSHTYKQQYITTFYASFIHKSITEVLIPDEQHNNITIQTHKNINQQILYPLNIAVPVKLFSWWNTSNEATIYSSAYKGLLADFSIHSSVLSFNAKSIQTFTLPKSYTIQLDGFVQYKEHYSFSTIEPFGAVNLSIQKTFHQKRTSLKLSANDIFFNSQFTGSSTYSNYYEKFHVSRNSRVIVLALTHRYGRTSVPNARRRGTGAEDEKQRAGKTS